MSTDENIEVARRHHWLGKWPRRLAFAALATLIGYVLLWSLTAYVSTHDLSPIARLFCTQEKCNAIDAIRAEGVRVAYFRSHLRNGWTIFGWDDPHLDDQRLAHLSTELRVLAPNVVFLTKTAVGDSGVSHLKDIMSIKYLDLGWTRIGDESLKSIATLPRLKELYVNNTNISDAGLRHLENLKDLQLLCVGQSRVTQQGDCTINHVPTRTCSR